MVFKEKKGKILYKCVRILFLNYTTLKIVIAMNRHKALTCCLLMKLIVKNYLRILFQNKCDFKFLCKLLLLLIMQTSVNSYENYKHIVWCK